jgi:hypothetical protein
MPNQVGQSRGESGGRSSVAEAIARDSTVRGACADDLESAVLLVVAYTDAIQSGMSARDGEHARYPADRARQPAILFSCGPT